MNVAPSYGVLKVFQRQLAPHQTDTLIEPRPLGLQERSVGGWLPERRLAPHQLAARFVLSNAATGARAVGYQLNRPTTREAERSIEELTRLRHRHLLPILEVAKPREGACWLVAAPEAAPTASTTLPVTLRDLVAQRPEGVLATSEALRVIVQLTATSAWAHERGLAHGPITITDILLSRRCVLMVELYGLGASLAAPHPELRTLAALEARSLGRLAIRLALGQDGPTPPRRAIAGAIGRAPAQWVSSLASGAFADAREAILDLPSALAHFVQDPGSTPSGGSPAGGRSAASSLTSASVS